MFNQNVLRTAIEYYNLGVESHYESKYEEAIECFNKAIELDYNNVNAYALKANTLRAMNKNEEALDILNATIAKNSNCTIAYYIKARIISATNIEEAKAILELGSKTHKEENNTFVLFFIKGAAFDSFNDYQEAIECYDKAIELDPKNFGTYFNKGAALQNLGEYTKAIECYDKAIELKPENSITYFNKGNALDDLGEYTKAIECFNKAIEIDPKNSEPYNGKGSVLQNLGEYTKAIEWFNKAIEIDPKYVSAYNDKGVCLQNLGQDMEAIKCYDMALKIDLKYVSAYSNKGNALYSLKNYQEAIKCYDKAIEIDPKYVNAYNGKGNALDELGEYTKAIECFNKAIELKPENSSAYNGKGSILQNLGEYTKAIECYDKAIEIDPKYVSAYNDKGVCLQNLGQDMEAIKCYDMALKIDLKYVSVYSNKGNALYSLRNYQEAIKCYDKAIEIDPKYVSAYNGKGILLEALNNYQGAIACYDIAIKIDPNSPLFYCNRSICYRSINKNEEALNDLKFASKLVDEGKVSNLSHKNIAYIKNTIKNIVELEEISLRVKKEITELDPHDKATAKIKADFKEIEKQKQVNDQALLKTLNAKVDSHASQDNQSELDRLKQETILLKKMFLDTLNQIEQQQQIMSGIKNRVSDVGRKVEHHEKALDKGGIFNNVKIQYAFEKLESEHPALGVYYKIFYWTMTNYFQAYRNASTGMFSINADYNTDSAFQNIERVNEYSGYINKGISAVGKVGEVIPLIGGIISAINNSVSFVCQEVKKYKFENEKKALSKIIQSKFILEGQISTQIGLGTINIINSKKAVIINPIKEEFGWFNKILGKISGSIEEIKSKLIEASVISYEEKNKEVAKIAIKDVILSLSYIYQNSDKISKSEMLLGEFFVEMANQEVSIIDTPKEGSACCTIFNLDLHYDNELLNYPDAFKIIANAIGIDEAIALGAEFNASSFDI